jgi:methylated-DNA-[protein]-cysteine S-methyltransferase
VKEKNICLPKKMGSPAGRIRLVASEKGLAAIGWENDHPNRVRLGNIVENDSHPVLLKTEQELREYFDGKRKVFSLIPIFTELNSG